MSQQPNATAAAPLELNGNLLLAYSSIVVMALVPIYLGSRLSLRRKLMKDENQEVMTSKDAYMYPVYGSAVLFGLYLLFRFFSKEYINLLLTSYFLFFGYFALVETFNPVIIHLGPLVNFFCSTNKIWIFQYRFPWQDELNSLNFNILSLFSWGLSFVCLLWYTLTKNWLANNLLGLAFSLQGVSLISLGSYKVGCILLGGLFLYDIFWVFGTDVMVTVAKSFDAPIKVLFPKSLFAETYSFSMLGLGDIVIPGIFLALLFRYDVERSALKKLPQKKPASSSSASFLTSLPYPYFHVTFVAYALGLILTIFIMHTFQAAQPALLYLVPACIGCSLGVSFLLGDLQGLWAFTEDEDDGKEKKKEKKEQNGKKNSKETQLKKDTQRSATPKKESTADATVERTPTPKKDNNNRSPTPKKETPPVSAQRTPTPFPQDQRKSKKKNL